MTFSAFEIAVKRGMPSANVQQKDSLREFPNERFQAKVNKRRECPSDRSQTKVRERSLAIVSKLKILSESYQAPVPYRKPPSQRAQTKVPKRKVLSS